MILITGVAGFLGSHIAEKLLGYNVIGLDDLSGGFKENIPTGVKFYKGSICDKKLIQKIFKKHKINYVIHCAAYAAENLSHFIKRFNYENNVIGSINLINESIKAKVKCFIFTSSIAVYGKGQVPFNELMKPEPEDSYGIAKYTIEQELKISQKIFGMPYIIFRPYNLYGTRQNIGDKYRNVIGIFMNQLLQDKPLTVFGDGYQERAFSCVNDVAPIIAESLFESRAYNNIFNIGAHTSYTINQMIKILLQVWGKKKHPINYLPARNEVKIAFSNCSHLKQFFIFKSKYTLKKGLIEMAEWVKKHGARQSKKFKNIEITEGLPESWKQ